MWYILETNQLCRDVVVCFHGVCAHMQGKRFICTALVAMAALQSYRCILRTRNDLKFF